MLVGKVIGNVWATRKDPGLSGLKLLVIKPIDHTSSGSRPELVAADSVGAGVGEMVLVVTGSSARRCLSKEGCPIDAMVVGIIDALEVQTDEEA